MATPAAAASTAEGRELDALDAEAPPPWSAGYTPLGVDERGLWQRAEESERGLQHSRLVITDPELNAYVRKVLCGSVGEERCAAVRIYIMRVPDFNAGMAPNGFMVINSGALLRFDNEAELAALLGHEYTHFEQRHSLRIFRSLRTTTDLSTLFAFIPYVGALGQLAVLGSTFQFSRDMERQADTQSLSVMVNAGYDSSAAPQVWQQLYDEAEARARARNSRNRAARPAGFFSTHPATLERLAYLNEQARALPTPQGDLGRDRYRQALSKWWLSLIDDQIKLNDFGATEYLLVQRAEAGGWTPELLFARGENHRARGQAGDFELAATYYREAIAADATIAEAQRGLGLALLRLGQTDEGRAALRIYLELKPEATDRAMIAVMTGS